MARAVDWEQRCAELYQVLGALAGEVGLFSHPEVQRALDYGSGRKIKGDLLPWPRTPLRTTDPGT